MSEWQSIDTAPKDGTVVLILTEVDQMSVARFKTLADGVSFWEVGASRDGTIHFLMHRATHWMPLPDRPLPNPPKDQT